MMFGSTKCLSLMQFVAGTRRGPLQVKTRAEAREGTPVGAIVGLALPHEPFQLFGEKRTDRLARFGRQDLGLPDDVRVQFERDICFHRTVYRAALFYVQWRCV